MKTYEQWVSARSAEAMREFELRERAVNPMTVSTYRSMPQPIVDAEVTRELAVFDQRRRTKRIIAGAIAIGLFALRMSVLALRSPGLAVAFGCTIGCTIAVAYALHIKLRRNASDLFS